VSNLTNCCDVSNPLVRDGVSQPQRLMPALPPDSIKVDEQDFADFLVFGYQLGKQIIYYNTDDIKPDGNWQGFFERSIPVQIALIGKTRPQAFRDTYNTQLIHFQENRTPENLSLLLLTLSQGFDQIRQWYRSLETYPPIMSLIKGLVKSNLRDSFLRLLAFDRSTTDKSRIQNSFYQDFNSAFQLNIDFQSPPATDPVLLQQGQGTEEESRNALDALFQVLFQNYRQIIQTTQKPNFLSNSLKAQQDHPPHLALYLAFWEVIKPARDDLNRMTQRHLDFFYRVVLQLPEKAMIPDQAHLIFELAKFQQEYKLDSGTLFKAGKDASGVELFYRLNEEILLHKAQIESLKGLFLASNETGNGIPKQLTGVHISPIANSSDGQGGDFPKDQLVKAWQPFGDLDRPHAAIGLAIASDVFYLQEGSRTITFTLTLDQAPVGLRNSDLPTLFTMDFSGKKDWIVGSIDASGDTSPASSTLKLIVNLSTIQDPIGAYHPGLPGALLSTDKPVARLHLKDQSQVNGQSPYSYFRNLKLLELTVQITVSEVRNLILQNEQSVLDSTKPFQPFGALPKTGMNFYIGSKEVFQKRLTALTLNLQLAVQKPDWASYYEAYIDTSNFDPGQLSVQVLRDQQWQPKSGISRSLFTLSTKPFSAAELTSLKLDNFANTEPFEKWDFQTKNGFIRLQLTGDDFLHDQYASVLARQVLAAATSEIITDARALPADFSPPQRKAVIGAYYLITSTGITDAKTYFIEPTAKPLIPKEPYTPVITSLSLSYEAEAHYAPQLTPNPVQQGVIQLFHLHPFDGFNALVPPLPHALFPIFLDEGTLYIGLQELTPLIALPLLFQVAEETANTDLLKADIHWSYLANNIWYPFEQHQIVSDSTNGLTTSGIVNLAIPSDISTGNTLLNPNLYWLKVTVPERSKSICNIIGVYTQAAVATFNDRGNDPTHLTTPLPAGTIAKLVDPQPAVKNIEQPFDSFGGQSKELPNDYYIRISERLRHKGRAISIFDYERLVLNRFPEIFKVRCINHGRINDQILDTNRDNLQELVPGSVTLAVIPDLSQRNTTNDLEPKVNINLLDEIRKYITTLSSSWVDIRVVNPRYEAIRVEFQVKFKSPFEANFDFYQRELQRAIIGFLSPWTSGKGANDIHFGGKVYRSSILNFVEEQPYVDYLLNFQMHQGNQNNLREAVASSARSILVSVPFSEGVKDPKSSHIITPVNSCPPNQPTSSGGLGYKTLNQLTLE
jgi:hypothetical protein